jgi:ATP-dependent DNA helicase PIF1
MTQSEALDILKTGANVFLTGEPGAGKTHTINAFVEYLRAREIEPAITASTGIAATHIGGMTIHSWSGIGIKSHLDKYDVDKIASSEYVAKRIGRTKVLIIDEISMLTANMVDMIDMVCREVRQNPEPFGGMQIIFVGDFFQLPPIVRREADPRKQKMLIETDEYAKNNNFAYDSGAWARAKPGVCYLSEQHRQDDDTFLSLLSAIRADNVEEEHFEHITSRQIDRSQMPENVTKLFTHNVDVDMVNSGELAKIKEKGKFFVMNSTGSEAMVASIKKGCLSPENLELKVGAVVMCTKNNPKEGYMNGTLGTVVGFAEPTDYPIIRAMNGKTIKITPMDWIVEENGKIRAQVTQVPLRLAWAITVHKSQGMSLDAAIMDLSNVFEFGQGYVALSRVRRLSGLYLLGINAQALRVHPDVLEKDIEFKQKSGEAVDVFGALSESELKKMHENFIIACGGSLKKEKQVKSVKKKMFAR